MGYPRRTWIAAGAAVLPLAGAAFYLMLSYDSLPDSYPRHWNWRGVADRFGQKSESAVFAVPFIGMVSLIAVMAAFAAQTQEREGSNRASPALLVSVAWFGSLMMSTVSLLPLIDRGAGVPWFLPLSLAGTAAIVVIAIRDSRRSKRDRRDDAG